MEARSVNNIDIAVCYHKPSMVFQSDALKPMQLGKVVAKVDLGIRGDDTGENISDKNRYYAEDTAFYWLWKNSRADVKGITHYRRLLDLSSPGGNEKTIVIDDIKSPEQFVSDLGLNSGNILKILESNDIIVRQKYDIRVDYSDYNMNLEKQYKISHIPEYLDYAMDIIKQNFPDIYLSAKTVLAGSTGHFFNICIMKSKYFDALCDFKFGVLTRLEKMVDVSRPEIADGWYHTGRYLAFVGERLTMFFLEYIKQCQVKIAEYPVAVLAPRGMSVGDVATFGENAYATKDEEQKKTINPVFGKDAVTVMLATNNTYAPYCGVVVQSIIENADAKKKYDIVIAEGDIDEKYKRLLESMARENISVRVINILEYIDKNLLKSFAINAHFSVETYYRFFIPLIFENYDKILYLDCDIVVLRDIAELYAKDIGDNWWGVTRDKNIPILCFDSATWEYREYVPYAETILKMDSLFNYFQAGVMIWNVRQCIRDNVYDKLMKRLVEIGNPHYVDQDVMNSVANGNKLFWISGYWNVPWYYSFFFPHYKGTFAYDTVMHQLENPFIIHYAGGIKPWREPERLNAHYFWRYARNSPFYETLLQISLIAAKNTGTKKITPRKIIKYLLPYGFVRLIQTGVKKNRLSYNREQNVGSNNKASRKRKTSVKKLIKYLLPYGLVRFIQVCIKNKAKK